ncbi:MAG: hypothetical protein NTZ33_11290 [Bacteroidetes bacterium]|nr:hypothetical protein [Bacteroidota bacterium]
MRDITVNINHNGQVSVRNSVNFQGENNASRFIFNIVEELRDKYIFLEAEFKNSVGVLTKLSYLIEPENDLFYFWIPSVHTDARNVKYHVVFKTSGGTIIIKSYEFKIVFKSTFNGDPGSIPESQDILTELIEKVNDAVVDPDYVHTDNNFTDDDKYIVTNGNIYLQIYPFCIEDTLVRTSVKSAKVINAEQGYVYSVFVIYNNHADYKYRLLIKKYKVSDGSFSLLVYEKNSIAEPLDEILFNSVSYDEKFILIIDYTEIPEFGSTVGMGCMIVNPRFYTYKITEFVSLTGAEDVDGKKNFLVSPLVPSALLPKNPVPLEQVETYHNVFSMVYPICVEDSSTRLAVKSAKVLNAYRGLVYGIYVIYNNHSLYKDRILMVQYEPSTGWSGIITCEITLAHHGLQEIFVPAGAGGYFGESFVLTIDYDTIVDGGVAGNSKPMIINPAFYEYNDSSVVKITGNQTISGLKTFNTDPIFPTPLSEYTYGANIQGVLSKLMAYRAGMLGGKVPKIKLLADSIGGGIWAIRWKSWMETEYELPESAIEIHWYGGYAIETMMPFIDNLIADNPDLFIYNEFENYGNTLTHLESIIQMLRRFTTADIAIGTWSISPAEIRLRVANPHGGTSNSLAQHYNRALARKYNCELIDFQNSVLDYINGQINGGVALETAITNVYGPGNESVHLADPGYLLTHFIEIKKHFGILKKNNNAPYVISKEEKILFADAIIYDNLKRKDLTIDESFILAANNIYTATTDAELIIPIKDAIGFELFLEEAGTGNVDITIKKEGEQSFVAPSTLTNNNYPLQFATEIVSLTHAENADLWRMKRPFMKCVVTDNILANGVLKSGQYKIVVTDVTLDDDLHQVVKCIVKNPSGVQIGDEFIVGESDVTIGNLYFPLQWNRSNNWIIDNSSTDNWGVPANGNYTIGDEYEFYIKSNWIDTFNKANVYQRVYGFERGNYDVKLKNISGAFWIHSINILKGISESIGQQGARGAQGPQGADGADGAQGPQGPQGPQGAAGSNGSNGSSGTDGKTILYGTAAPTTEGVNGDFYIRTTTNYIYGPKAGGSWPAGTSLVGPQGPQGAAGANASFWNTMPGTPVRTGNTTFTVTGDITTYVAKGMIIKWLESSVVRCAMVSIPSTYGAPNTTITIVGDTMASIDAGSLKYCMLGAEMFMQKFAVAGTIGATGTDIANAYYATEPMRVIASDLQVGTAGTTNSTTVDINKNGITMFTAKPTLASTVATSPTPYTADTATSLALADKVTLDVDAVQTTAAIDLYLQLYVFPTRYLYLT